MMITSGSPVVLTLKDVDSGYVYSMQQVAPQDIDRIESDLKSQAEKLKADGKNVQVFKLSRV